MSQPITIPLANVSAERAVIGALMYDSNRLADIDTILVTKDFTDDRHRVLFAAIIDMVSDGIEIDEVSLYSWLSSHGKLDDSGGASYVGSLRDYLPDTGNVKFYAETVADLAVRRSLNALSVKVGGMATGSTTPTAEIVEFASQELASLQTERGERDAVSIGEAASEELGRMRAEVESRRSSAWAETGLSRIDACLGGLRPGQLVVVAARTSVGKTALGLQIALEASLVQGKKVLFWSLEMSTEELARRAIAQTSRVAFGKLQHVDLDDPRWPETRGHWDAVERAVAELKGAGLTIVDSGAVTPGALRSRCRLRQLQGGLDLVVVDYLQLMASGERHDGRPAEVGAISRGLKWVARDLRVPILAMSQLNREPEKRDTRMGPATLSHSKGEPRLSDLRESGAIENDAHAVLLLHRKVEGTWEEITTATAILAKNRTGPTGRWALDYEPSCCRFKET